MKLASPVSVGATGGNRFHGRHSHTQPELENPRMSEIQNQFKGIRRFLWLAVGFSLLAAALGSAAYIVAHIFKCF